MLAVKSSPKSAPKLTRRDRVNLTKGLLFISPWILGLVIFVLYPMIYSIVLSFARYSGFKDPVWLGFQNYTRLFGDSLFWLSLGNTLYYVLWAVPVGIVVAILLAVAMNRDVREVGIYRAILYLPSILPAFAMAFIFIVLVNPQYGIVNFIFSLFGAPTQNFLGDPTGAKNVIIALAQLGAGNAALIFLAGLRGIPDTLYDAARIDGAGTFRRFFSITLPLLSPIILFNLITALSGGLQIFQQAYIMTNGGPNNGTLFYLLYLYRNAFAYAQLGYACALSLVLFIIGLALAGVLFTVSQRFVNYELVG
ncbi:carbohydrate ABC transporter permease [Dictyobacter formicarum]|uniref:Sugar ABC transporter permease n=1 Tax=Dictyobacter formicarum TaxID=2778368 RepID=A0ABQ3VR96_9CHLR|nr:sugar ABC transporter permease [Dictyobacter formicarum]GHO88402.1 sugar ABC transporter permease [Dictyobacter formicarum]